MNRLAVIVALAMLYGCGPPRLVRDDGDWTPSMADEPVAIAPTTVPSFMMHAPAAMPMGAASQRWQQHPAFCGMGSGADRMQVCN